MNGKMLVVGFAAMAGMAGAATVRPQETDEALVNPGMGLTQYHMAGRMWAYGATIPPGDTLAWFPGVSTVYFRLLWSELEPQEGVYRWDLIDAIAGNWVRDGKQICLRVICCNHTKNACPDFVREAGAKGTWFRYQKHGVPKDFPLRWEPIYDDPVFLEKYSNFLKAFAKRYDGSPAVAFVDIGSFGMYGEGHTGGGSHPLDKAETDRITRLHIDLHRRLLPNTYLVISDDVAGSGGQEDEAPLMKYAREHGVGYRDDSIFCMGPETNSYAREGSWAHSHWARNFAPTTPVVIEPGHWMSCDQHGEWIKDRIVTCIERHQASYFGIHGFPRPFFEAHKDVLPAINRRLGYRFALLEVSWPDVVRPDEPVTIRSTWLNRGVAWLHRGASLTWNLLDDKGTVCWSSTDAKFDFRSLDPTLNGVEKPQAVESRCFFGHDEPVLPFDNVARSVRAAGHDPGETYVMLRPGRYTLAVSVGEPDGRPAIALPLANGANRIYPLGPIEVQPVETVRIQAEIDRVAAQGGGRVTVGRGVHRCGTLYLKSNVELHLEEGAELLGGLTPADYDDAIPLREVYTYEGAVPATVTRKAFVYAENATNIAITGKGVINGRGQAFFNQKTWAKPKDVLRPRMVVFMNCRGVRLEDATFKDSPVWTFWLRRCEDVTVSRIRVDADQRMINTDGIDIDACRRVRVGDSFFSTGDDCLVLRAIFHKGDTAEAVTEDVVVSNCCLSTTCQGVRIACPSDRVIRNAVFRDMTFTGRNAIFADQQRWYLEEGNTGNITTSNILFENWKIDCRGYPISLAVTDGVTLRDFGHMTFRNIEIRSKKPVNLRGNATTVVKDIVLENIRGTVEAEPTLVNDRTEGVRISGWAVRPGK